MLLTRRRILQLAGPLAGALSWAPVFAQKKPFPLTPFVDPLPIPPIAQHKGFKKVPGRSTQQAPLYRMAMRQVESKIHRDLPPATLWTYDGTWPGPTIEARSGQGIWIEWANELPLKHLFPVDHSLHGSEADKPDVRTIVHVHGARVPPESDGYPDNWYQPGKSGTSFYPNQQDAMLLWYHDHAMGITRLNTYAGLMGAYIVRDDFEDALNLPKGPYEIPLVICDRLLRPNGQLNYPVSDMPGKPWVPEVFGDVMTVNGKAYPFLDVEPRRYRFRVLNGSNGRFYHLSLLNGPKFHQIGSDQGLLPSPVELEHLVIAPGERADLIIDFASHANTQIVLASDAFQLMQFRVGAEKSRDGSTLPATLRPVPRMLETSAVKTRIHTIDEMKSAPGETMMMMLNGAHWSDPVTENPLLNSVEIWTILNPTDDSHPIHLHLVRFQILDRRKYEPFDYLTEQKIRYTGPAIPPEPSEAGWKDTVRAESKMVTRIIVKFEGYLGRYVWHCHLLEHEDNEMMRPYEIIAADKAHRPAGSN